MAVFNCWKKDAPIPQYIQPDWDAKTPSVGSARSSPTRSEDILNNYIDIIHSKSNISTEAKQTENLERPFDFFDDEEFAFGINLLNNNVACVGDNMTKLIQMAQEPWPDNVKLFQPYEVEQILLPDNASCLAVQAFLKMCNLPFEVEMRWNAEFMSPSGRVPFIKCGAFVVSELEPIVQFAANKGVSLCSRLSSEEKAEMRAYMSLITNVLVNAELYISWLDEETFSSVTKIRNSSVYPWPLGWLQTRSKRASVAKRLKALHWHNKTLDQVLADVEQCCNSLSQRLGERDFFFGTCTPLDTLVYGHMRALLSSTEPRATRLIKHVTAALLRHTIRIANLTGMKLTPQEEYLVSAAQNANLLRLSPERQRRRASPEYTLSPERRRLSPELRDRARSRRRTRQREDAKRSVFGFEPSFGKQTTATMRETVLNSVYDTTNHGDITIVDDIIDDIIEHVEVQTVEIHDKPDFEMVIYNNPNADSMHEYLDTIQERDTTDTNASETSDDDLVKVHNIDQCGDAPVNQFELNVGFDCDGLVMERLLRPVGLTSVPVKIMRGPRPTELDALVFGHVFTIITTRLPCRKLAETVRKHETLVALAQRVDEKYFRRP